MAEPIRNLPRAIDRLTRGAGRLEDGTAPPRAAPRSVQRILLAVEDSETSRQAAAWAGLLAKTFGAKVWVTTVVTAPDALDHALDYLAFLGVPTSRDFAKEELTRGHALLDHHVRELRQAGLHAEGFLAAGPPVREVVRAAQAKHADLVVLGAHGGHRLRRLLGSVADGVKDHVAASVLLARDTPPPRLVLAATDGSTASKHAAALALQLGQAWNVPVTVLYVFDPPQYGPVDEVHRAFERATVDVELRRGTPEVSLGAEFGMPAERIAAMARERGAGLIVMGSRGLSGLASLVPGSVSRRVAHEATCSVLIVKEEPVLAHP